MISQQIIMLECQCILKKKKDACIVIQLINSQKNSILKKNCDICQTLHYLFASSIKSEHKFLKHKQL